MFNLLRGQKRGWDRGQEKGLCQKTTPIKLTLFHNNLENMVFLKKCNFDEKIQSGVLLPNNIMTGCQIEQICKSCSNLKNAIKEIQNFCLEK